MTTAVIIIFVAGYFLIAMENMTRVNKSAIALIMAVICWSIIFICKGATPEHVSSLTESLGETSEILFFLLGAMVIVEVVDTNGGFNFVRDRLASASKVGLLWKLTLITFFLSALLDNMTTAIVMAMVLNKLVSEPKDRLCYSSMIILAANSGGAFSPIGDVTTIMLWVKGNISTLGVIKGLFVPSLVSVLVPAVIMSFMLKGPLVISGTQVRDEEKTDVHINRPERATVFIIGVVGLLFVPVFRFITGLPPYMGILLILGLLWVVTEFIFKQKKYQDIEPSHLPDVSAILHRIDLGTILFFLGILTAVSALGEIGLLRQAGAFLDSSFDGNPYFVTGLIGVLSSIVDNVPLVASCMGMYEVTGAAGVYSIDGTFWLLLAYCAGIGGSMLIIGSAAGVVLMGLQKIPFGWYLKHFTWIAAIGYFSGILAFMIQEMLLR